MKLCVLDADGVLLNYHQAFKETYEKMFERQCHVVSPTSYLSLKYFGLPDFSEEEMTKFKKEFIQQWNSMMALEGANEAISILKEKNYKIIVLTAIPEEHVQAREENFKKLKMNIDAVIASPVKKKDVNPKKEYLDVLQPHFFVDDYIENFKQLSMNGKKVLIQKNHHDIDDYQQKIKKYEINHVHGNLLDYVRSL